MPTLIRLSLSFCFFLFLLFLLSYFLPFSLPSTQWLFVCHFQLYIFPLLFYAYTITVITYKAVLFSLLHWYFLPLPTSLFRLFLPRFKSLSPARFPIQYSSPPFSIFTTKPRNPVASHLPSLFFLLSVFSFSWAARTFFSTEVPISFSSSPSLFNSSCLLSPFSLQTREIPVAPHLPSFFNSLLLLVSWNAGRLHSLAFPLP